MKKKKLTDPYYTVGVRFLTDVSKVFTYKVHRKKKVLLGQELVADTPRGPAVVVVVRIDTTRQDTQYGITYKFLTRKVSPL